MRGLGRADSGGAVRAGFLHYTTEEEVDRLLEALAELPKSQGLRARAFLAPGGLPAPRGGGRGGAPGGAVGRGMCPARRSPR